MTKQLTPKQASDLYDSKVWEKWTPQEIAAFQMEQPFLCVPFSVFQNAMQVVLDRPVWTHEFAAPDRLRAEMDGKAKAPHSRKS